MLGEQQRASKKEKEKEKDRVDIEKQIYIEEIEKMIELHG